MPLGEFAIGRSSSCNLALADGLGSRKHAVLHVGPEAVVVEDLGSRNGVAVNGVRINTPRRLSHMDRVYIGSQELVLIDAAKLREGTKETAEYVVCISCGAINGSAKRRCGECGKRLSSTAGETLASTSSQVDSTSHAWGAEDTRTARALDVIAGIASKAIAMGRFEESAQPVGHDIGRQDRIEWSVDGYPCGQPADGPGHCRPDRLHFFLCEQVEDHLAQFDFGCHGQKFQ